MKYLVFCLVLCFVSVSMAEPTAPPAPTASDSSQIEAAATTSTKAADSEQSAIAQSPAPTPDAQPSLTVPAATNATKTKPAQNENSEATGYLLLGAVGLLALIGTGTALGANGKLVIYNGWFDFFLSLALPVLVFFREEHIQIIACLLLVLSIELSCHGNRSLLKIFLVFPAKFGLPILTLLASFLALGSVSKLLGGKFKDDRDAAKGILEGAAWAAGFYYFTKLIRKLIVTPASSELGLLKNGQHHQENV